MEQTNFWRLCSECKKPIGFRAKHYVCNVSTCNQKRTSWVFCRVECWDAHVPKMRHKESWAVEVMGPTSEEWKKIQSGEINPRSRKEESEVEATSKAPPRPTGTVIRRKNS